MFYPAIGLYAWLARLPSIQLPIQCECGLPFKDRRPYVTQDFAGVECTCECGRVQNVGQTRTRESQEKWESLLLGISE